MLSQVEITEFHEKGYLNGGFLLDDREVEFLREELTRVIEDQDRPDLHQPVLIRNLSKGHFGVENEKAPIWQIVNIWEASEAFRTLLSKQKVLEEIAQLTDATALRIWHDQIQFKPAQEGGPLSWHQDAPLWPIIMPMTEVSAWVALDNVDESNGCMRMVPGSHLWGNQIGFLRGLSNLEEMPVKFNGHKVDVMMCPVMQGEVHYHHALTWHGSHSNSSNRPRRAIAIHYMTQDARYQASGEHAMKAFVEVGDGELMEGKHFPQVWTRN